MNKILIVEDDPSWTSTLRKYTESKKTVIDTVDSISLAREKLQSQKYNLIIADLRMSRGQKKLYETLSSINYSLIDQDATQFPPVIIVTGSILDYSDIIDAINKYPGWIGGWHEKDIFDPESFQKNVLSNLKIINKRTAFSAPHWWRIVLTIVGLFVIISGAGWLFQINASPQLETLLLTITKATTILGLAIVLLAHPDKLADVISLINRKET